MARWQNGYAPDCKSVDAGSLMSQRDKRSLVERSERSERERMVSEANIPTADFARAKHGRKIERII